MTHNGKLRVLSLSCTYPNSAHRELGVFVRARLASLHQLAEVKVIAPIAIFEYGNNASRKTERPPVVVLTDGSMEVIHPLWFYPPMGGVLNALALALQLLVPVQRLRRLYSFDIIDAHFAFPDGIAAALLAWYFHCPFTITLRGNETLHASFRWRGVAIRWAIRRAARIIAVSEPLRQFALSCGAKPHRTRVIPNGIDSSIFFRRPAGDVRAKLNLPPTVHLLLSTGYLIERKGHHHVIRALAGLRERGIPVHLVIAGGGGAEGNFAPVLHKLVAELSLQPFVHFTGPVEPDTLAELMSEAHVFCLASDREGWPNVVNEALACGAPVVATDVGGIPAMLPSENVGFVVPMNDPHALLAALDRAFTAPWDREAISAWGRSRSWNRVASEVLESLESVFAAVEKEPSL